jgi:hypothetical protein
MKEAESRVASEELGRVLIRRVRWLTTVFVAGLVLSGATAIPIETQLNWGAAWAGSMPSELAVWLGRVREAVHASNVSHPFLAYGTDWLAFGHFAIAVLFLGAVRDPVRNAALYRSGMVVCLLVIPYALALGAVRGIPLWWRLIDCRFGIGGFVPLWLCHRWIRRCHPAA